MARNKELDSKARDAILQPFADVVSTSCWIVSHCDDDTLRNLRTACDMVTPTNCSWQIYAAAKMIEREVVFECRRRGME